MYTSGFPQNVAAAGTISTVTATPVTQTFYGHDTNTLVGTSGQSTACCDLYSAKVCGQLAKVADNSDQGRIYFQGMTAKSRVMHIADATTPTALGKTNWHMDYVLASSW